LVRRLASIFTSFITCNPPYAPEPTTSRRHFQGICSSMDNGVCPKESRNFFDGFFFRLLTSPRSITTSCSWVMPSILIEPKEKSSKRIPTSKGPPFTLGSVKRSVDVPVVQQI